MDLTAYTVGGAWQDYGSFRERRRTALGGAAYDDAAWTVTLLPHEVPFVASRRLRSLTVDATKVRDASGLELDGDGDGVGGDDAYRLFRHIRRRVVRYADATRSRVTLNLTGPGRLYLTQTMESTRVRIGDDVNASQYRLRFFGQGEGQQLWVEGATAESVLTGTVTAGGRGAGDATTSLIEIINPGGARLDLLADPAFQVIA